MKISYNWLREYVPITLTPEELKERLTFAGIEVEAVETIGRTLRSIQVARIVEKEKHPGADKLSVCRVDTGSETLQVVCGAPNCVAGQTIAFAPIGAQVGEIRIQKAKLRGVESFGMICSAKELGLSEDHSGIMVLPEDAPIGASLAEYLDLTDTVYDVEITPNRPDLLGMIGVARDLSALLDLPFKSPKVTFSESEAHAIDEILNLRNEAPELCTRYTARVIRGVTVKESPVWMQKRLKAVGLRPINNIVDVTNYVLMEYGHPLHAFDYNLVREHTIVVRRATDGEPFRALDGSDHKLVSDDLVIADATHPIALAGVMGGENSQITGTTTDIIIEAANFLYSSIRRTSDRQKLESDSSYRFERDLSDKTALAAGERAVQLILETAGGELYRGVLDSWPVKHQRRQLISFRPDRVRSLLAAPIPDRKMIGYLEALGARLHSKTPTEMMFVAPHYRKDLTREVDLAEEIIRLHGYNNVETRLHPSQIMNREYFAMRRSAQDAMVALGFNETINWPFGDPESLDVLEIPAGDERRELVMLRNPVGVRFSAMQTTLLPNLLRNALHNINRGEKSFMLFEQARVYFRTIEKLAREETRLAGLLLGDAETDHWSRTNRAVDFYDCKGAVETVMETISLRPAEFQTGSEPFLMRGQSADITLHDAKVGYLGRLDPRIAKRFELEVPVYVFEISLDAVASLRGGMLRRFEELPKYPPVLRDISFIIDARHTLKDIEREMHASAIETLRDTILFDEFKGKGISDGYRSLSFHLTFYSRTKTLTGENVSQLFDKLVNHLKTKFQIEMR
jgi:phenylalanyl-tRNA synthetase beta chain